MKITTAKSDPNMSWRLLQLKVILTCHEDYYLGKWSWHKWFWHVKKNTIAKSFPNESDPDESDPDVPWRLL